MSRYRSELPQLSGGLYLTDAGVETDLIFNHGVEIEQFATHTLLPHPTRRDQLANYLRGYLALARDVGAGFLLDSQTWKAHPHWAADLGATPDELRQANHDSLRFIAELRDEFMPSEHPIVLNGVIGPRGDAYAPELQLAADEARRYHATQISWLRETEVDMLTAMTFTHSSEAIGIVRAARAAELPIVISFTVETDGRLPSGESLREAIESTDSATDSAAAYFMLNCAHPEHFAHVLEDAPWCRRLRGLRCNASRQSHAQLDAALTLDAGDPVELAARYAELHARLPWLHIFGGCCGTDLRHVTEIARFVGA